MGCNCATNEQIAKLYRKYGEGRQAPKPFAMKAKNFFRKVAVGFCLIFITPAIVLYVFYKAFSGEDNRISVKKFFHLHNKQLGTNVG